MSLLFNMLSRLVITFLPRSKCLLISWLQSPSAVILEPKKIKSVPVSIVSPSICHEVMGPDAMRFVFWILSFSQVFHSPLSLSSRGSSIPLHFLPLGWHHLHIWGYWYFSWQSWLQPVLHSCLAFHKMYSVPQRLRQNCVSVSPVEVQVSSGLPQGQGLWVQQTWVWHKPSWRRSPLTHHRAARTYTGLGKQPLGQDK